MCTSRRKHTACTFFIGLSDDDAPSHSSSKLSLDFGPRLGPGQAPLRIFGISLSLACWDYTCVVNLIGSAVKRELRSGTNCVAAASGSGGSRKIDLIGDNYARLPS